MHSVAGYQQRTHAPAVARAETRKNRLSIEISKSRHACALALALCALQGVSSERDEHGMRQALRLARMRAPRGAPGAGRAQRRTGGMRISTAARTARGSGPAQSTSSRSSPQNRRSICGRRLLRLWASHVKIDALVCVRRVARAPRRRGLGCLCGYARREPLLGSFGDWNEFWGSKARGPLPGPGCPLRCLFVGKQVQGGREE